MAKKQVNEIIGEYTTWFAIDISTPSCPESVMLIDVGDWTHLKNLGIGRVGAYMDSKRHSYPYAQVKLNGKQKRVHRLILPNAEVIDHINRNGLDNRRTNLNPCTQHENALNRCVNRNSKTGIRGVGYDKKSGKYRARIPFYGKTTTLGFFNYIQDAEEAVLKSLGKWEEN